MQEKLKLEVGKSYRTRGGRKAEITRESPKLYFCFFGYVNGLEATWTKEGLYTSNGKDDIDIVATWGDELIKTPCRCIDCGGTESHHSPDCEYMLEMTRDQTPHVNTFKDALRSQVGGSHYKDMPIQPVEFCQKNRLNYCESNVVKYVCRHRSKNGRQDIEKAIHYLQLLLDIEYPLNAPDQRPRP